MNVRPGQVNRIKMDATRIQISCAAHIEHTKFPRALRYRKASAGAKRYDPAFKRLMVIVHPSSAGGGET
jgi:hypothetical protein